MNPAAKRRQAITLADNSAGVIGRATSIRARLRAILLSDHPLEPTVAEMIAACAVDACDISRLLGANPHE